MNDLKKILPVALFVIIVVTLLFFISTKRKANKEIASNFEIIDFNDFNFLEPVEDYELNENSVICFFASDCSLCSYEAKQLKKEDFVPENLDFIWVSSQNRDSIVSFIKSNDIAGVEHFKFAQIEASVLTEKYNINEYPKGLIYKNGILCHSFKGLISLFTIKEHLNQEIPN
ncbi:redoxin domain-containing protein [Marinifilum caeruleilacunae]|uniref:Redoxin domain-containing protein n=1 Tax=Marinifilum caeruleilacunae TaxID=2499076 RepID=A0ABX1WZK9_9BACT|nr:redoxin domain-containing protein [Marinifilum caeruleilacunae]NOU61605.1 redoxin domain-containing protein [Marinifilum caeruleilacunae]